MPFHNGSQQELGIRAARRRMGPWGRSSRWITQRLAKSNQKKRARNGFEIDTDSYCILYQICSPKQTKEKLYTYCVKLRSWPMQTQKDMTWSQRGPATIHARGWLWPAHRHQAHVSICSTGTSLLELLPATSWKKWGRLVIDERALILHTSTLTGKISSSAVAVGVCGQEQGCSVLGNHLPGELC